MLHRRLTPTLIAIALAGCDAHDERAPAPQAPVATTPLPAKPASLWDPGFPACPPEMVLVQGLFCPEVDQRCLEYHPEYLADRSTSERCLRYAEPSSCATEDRTAMRFCIDRYEWPNRRGELPHVLVDWKEARAQCESIGKRLCDEPEWLFACEGEEMAPYVYGYERNPTACVIDRLYVEVPDVLFHHERCMASPSCRRNFEKLDQREPVGSFPACRSPFGVYDMNGNVNEWVNVPNAEPPRRSGLKGGWWGPVRNRCRPTVRFHKEDDYGYEIGFRCCRDAAP